MMTRAFKRSVCRVLIGVLLFAQFAIAAHACQDLAKNAQSARGMETAALDRSAAMTASGTDSDSSGALPCDGMGAPPDGSGGNICIEHCRFGHQTFDPGQPPSVTPGLFAVLYVVPGLLFAEAPRPMQAATRAACVAASPPHSILHCCLRI